MRHRMRPINTSEVLLRGRPTNADIPSGAMYPNGLPLTEANPVVQATTRPPGTIFAQSPGYETVRVGKTRLQDPRDAGSIGFVGIDLAEDPRDPSQSLVDSNLVGTHAEEARIHPDLPNGGDHAQTPAVSSGLQFPVEATRLHRLYDSPPDMGDREANRPLTRAALMADPLGMLRQEWRDKPLTALLVGGAIVTLAYVIGNDLEREFKSRRGRGVGGTAAAAAPATVATAGREAERATTVAADAVKEAGAAVKEATESVADAVKPD